MVLEKYETPDQSLQVLSDTDGKDLFLMFLGKSRDREPGDFINPILNAAYENALENRRSLVLDFSRLEYMNSASITPIIKFWSRLKAAGISLKIVYNPEIAWQKTSFSAFVVFEKESDLFQLKPESKLNVDTNI